MIAGLDSTTDTPMDTRMEFVSGGLPDRLLHLQSIRGREAISSLFAFELGLVGKGERLTADELDELLRAPCVFSFGSEEHVVRGIVRAVDVLYTLENGATVYRVEVVPTVSLLTLGRNNRIFQAVTTADVVHAVLQRYGMSDGKEYELRIARKLVSREYVVQYQESDWDFLQRWLEYEGLFYWFEHDGPKDRLVIADGNEAVHPALAVPLPFREHNLGAAPDSVWDYHLRVRRIPARIALADYNYRAPHVALTAKAEVDVARGFGTVLTTGEHFKTQEEGAAIAVLRAERARSERRTYSGKTGCRSLRAGTSFEVADHPSADMDGRFLAISVEHSAGPPLTDEPSTEPLGEQLYQARFEAIPMSVPHRPALVTPWPSIHGVLHAHVDAEGAGEYAMIDSQGRYKVRLPFDSGNAKAGLASRWIRMAQPNIGAGYGSHHPLHKGTEVLLVHVDGDPDRPIIAGAVPNAQTTSPSTAANATQSIIATASGIRIVMEDLQKLSD